MEKVIRLIFLNLVLAGTVLSCAFFSKDSVYAAALTSVSNIPWSSDVGVTGKQTIYFTTATTIPNNGKILITFPSGFDVTPVTFDSWSGFDGGHSISVSSQVITITRDGAGTNSVAGVKYIVLNAVTNNAAAAANYTIAVETQDSSGATLDGQTTSANFSVTSLNDRLDTDSPWAIHGHDSRNTFNTSNNGPMYPAIAWKFSYSSGSNTHRGALLGQDGTVYAISNDTVYALNSDGSVKWSVLHGQNRLKGAVLTENGRIVAHFTGGVVKAFNITDGSEVWSYSSGIFGDTNSINIGPDGTVYLVSRSEGFSAINSDGTLKFHLALYGRDSWPVVDPITGEIYTSSDANENAIFPGGIAKWSVERTNSVGNAPVLSSDGSKLFIEGRGGAYPVVSINSSDGSLRWSVANTGDGYAAPALSSDESVLYTTRDTTKELTARNPDTGDVFWTSVYNNVDWINNLAVDGNDSIYVGTYAFNANGTKRWSFNGILNSFPAIGTSGVMVYTNNAGTLYGLKNWTISASANTGYYQPGATVTITAISSMLRMDPTNPGEDNKVQAIMPNGDKVLLAYASAADGSTSWVGTYTIPSGTVEGNYSAIIEAGQFNIETDVTTHFDTAATGTNNTGITSTFSYNVDTSNPSGSVVINDGDMITNARTLTLALAATDSFSSVTEMMLSEDEAFTGGSWEVYASSKEIEVSESDGTKNVYAKFKDSAGNLSAVYSDSIVLDTTGPSGTLAITPTDITKSPEVILALSATDTLSTVTDVMLSETENFDGAVWIFYEVSKNFTLSLGDGQKTVYAKFRDSLGNEGQTVMATVTLDTILPSSVRITDIGLIPNIPNMRNLFYYFTSQVVRIKGTAEPLSMVSFKSSDDNHVYHTSTNFLGAFSIVIKDPVLPKGTVSLQFYSQDLAGNISAFRTLTLVIGEENFPVEEVEVVEEEITEVTQTPTIEITETPTPRQTTEITETPSVTTKPKGILGMIGAFFVGIWQFVLRIFGKA